MGRIFIITRLAKNKFKSYVFQASIDWDEMLKKIEGTVIELFKNDILEPTDFESYFNANYNKKQVRPENKFNKRLR